MAKGKLGLVGRETTESAAEKAPDHKPKQGSLTGMEDRKIPDLHKAAEKYVEARDRRMQMTPAEKRTKDDLIAQMKKHEKTHYLCDGIEITLKMSVEGVTVKQIDETEAEK